MQSIWPSRTSSEFSFTTDWMSWRTPHWKKNLKGFRDKPNLRYLEIGTFEGRSLLWMFENILTHPTSSADVIDIFRDGTEKRFNHNLSVARIQDRVRVFKSSSELILSSLSHEKYDMIYIDGCHCVRHVLTDAVLCWDLLSVGGIMIFDDYGLKTSSTKIKPPSVAIDAFMACFEAEFKVLFKGYDVVLQRTDKIHF